MKKEDEILRYLVVLNCKGVKYGTIRASKRKEFKTKMVGKYTKNKYDSVDVWFRP